MTKSKVEMTKAVADEEMTKREMELTNGG